MGRERKVVKKVAQYLATSGQNSGSQTVACWNMVWYSMVWYGMVWYGMGCGMVRYGTVQCGMVQGVEKEGSPKTGESPNKFDRRATRTKKGWV